MKIPGSDGNEKRVDLVQEKTRVAQNSGKTSGAQGVGSNRTETQILSVDSDSVQVSSLAAALQSELDPVKMAEERRSKIEDLKRRIAAGTYKPSADVIASALSEEISIEVMLGAGASSSADSGDELL